MLKRWFIGSIAFLVLAACGPSGSGNVVDEVRDVGAFDRIAVGSALNLVVMVEPGADHLVTVGYDDNLQEQIIARVDGATLILEIEGTVNLTGDGRSIDVVMPDLEAITASGATRVSARGTIDRLVLEASGASDVDLSGLDVVDVELDVSGASNVAIVATGSVVGVASGASNVSISGGATAAVDTSGASSVDVEG